MENNMKRLSLLMGALTLFVANGAFADSIEFYCESSDGGLIHLDGIFGYDRMTQAGSVSLRARLPGELSIVTQSGTGQFIDNGSISYSSTGSGQDFNHPTEGVFSNQFGNSNGFSKLVINPDGDQEGYPLNCLFGNDPTPVCYGNCGMGH
jgi:hypothetical protein